MPAWAPENLNLRTACVLCTLLSIATANADEPKRVALVIGNSDYKSAPLTNPANDAEAVSLALKGLGFEVTVKKNVTKSQFEHAVDKVTDNLQKGDLCLIFYAGHGQGFENDNYLIPIGATLDKPQHVKERCVSVSYLLSALNYSECSLKVVVIDACRNNPFRSFVRSRQGLQRQDAPDGTIVSFSTAPKTPALDGRGDNSPYVTQMVGAMRSRADKVEIVRLFREVSQKVKIETGQRPHLDFDASMPDYFLKRRRDLAPDVPEMKVEQTPPKTDARQLITNSIGMQLRLIPGGDFVMGSPASEKDRNDDEQQHRVRIAKPFYLQTTEVTQSQWESVMGTEPWNDKEYVKKGANYPATYVNWEDAVEFCQKLSERDGVTYRLPTEAEWEYACRAGSRQMYSFGDSVDQLGQHGWYNKNTYDIDKHYAHPVGQKRPNGLGLHDMHGNVWEWCSDWYAEDYYTNSPSDDPPGPPSGSNRVFRGGSWNDSPQYCRSASRLRNAPSSRYDYLGFRVLRSSVK